MKLSGFFALSLLGSTAALADNFVLSDSITEGSITSDTTKPSVYQAVGKDGQGTVTITDNITKYQAIYVREGELLIGNPDKKITVTINPDYSGTPASPYLPMMVVGGKNTGNEYATVTFNNAQLTSGTDATVIIGSADGNGAMVIDNKSVVCLDWHSQTTIIGEKKGDSWSSTTVDANGNQYVGTYSPAANGSGVEFGRGVVTVKGESTFNTGYNQFLMSEGELNVIGKNTQVNIGGYGSDSRAFLAYDANSTSTINVQDGAKVNVRSAQFYTGYYGADNSTININVDGQGSAFTVDATTAAHPENPNSVVPTATVFGMYSGDAAGSPPIKSNTAINVANGGTMEILSNMIFFGYGKQSEGSSVTVNIDDESFFNSKKAYMYDGASIENDGIVQIEKLSMQGGEVINTGVIQTMNENDNILELLGQGSKIINSGIIENDIALYSGTVTGLDGGEFAGLHLLGGSLRIEGTVKFNSFFSGYSAGELVFTEGGLLDMQNNYFALNSSVLVFEVGFDVSEDTTLTLSDFIVNAGGYGISDDTVLTIRGTNGTSINRTYGQVIPEPTTATLSLLALAGLAARRRRR